MNTRAKILGVKGVVVDGRVRDLDELRSDETPVCNSGLQIFFFLKKKLKYIQVFARAASILSSNEFTRPSALNIPITLNGNHDPPIKINPDDIILADLNGVVCIPKDLLDQVLDSCEKHTMMDKNLKNALYEGMTLAEAKSIHRKG